MCLLYLVPGDGAVHWVCVLKAVRLLHLVDFVLYSKPLLHKGLVGDHNLQILHHLTGCIYVHILIVISVQKSAAIIKGLSAVLLYVTITMVQSIAVLSIS